MKLCKYFSLGRMSFLTMTVFLLTPICRADDSQSPQTVTNGVAADNSGQNSEERNRGSLTADNQSNSRADINITKEIRQSVERNDNFSILAKNVKIITVNGVVTLRGPVKTAEEKSNIEQIAQKLAGGNNVNDQLEIKNNQ